MPCQTIEARAVPRGPQQLVQQEGAQEAGGPREQDGGRFAQARCPDLPGGSDPRVQLCVVGQRDSRFHTWPSVLQVCSQRVYGGVLVDLRALKRDPKDTLDVQCKSQACQGVAAQVEEVPIVLQRTGVDVQGLSPQLPQDPAALLRSGILREPWALLDGGPALAQRGQGLAIQLARLLVQRKRLQLHVAAGHHVVGQVPLQQVPKVPAGAAPGFDPPRCPGSPDDVGDQALVGLVHGLHRYRRVRHAAVLAQHLLDGPEVHGVPPDLDHGVVPANDGRHAPGVDLGQVAGGVVPLAVLPEEPLGVQVGPSQVSPGQPAAADEQLSAPPGGQDGPSLGHDPDLHPVHGKTHRAHVPAIQGQARELDSADVVGLADAVGVEHPGGAGEDLQRLPQQARRDHLAVQPHDPQGGEPGPDVVAVPRDQDPLQQGRGEQHLGDAVLGDERGQGPGQEHHVVGDYVYRRPLQQRAEVLPGEEDVAGDPVPRLVGAEPVPGVV